MCIRDSQLTEEQRRGRVEWCIHILRKFDRGRTKWVFDTGTSNETVVYQYDPKTEESSAWLFPGENPSVKFKRSKSTSRQMIAVFFAISGHVASVPPQQRQKSTPADIPTFACTRYSRLGVHSDQTTALAICCPTTTTPAPTSQPPFWTTW